MNRLLLALLAALLLPLASMAAETQTVNATGYGTTVDEAKMVAVRSAVEAVVGTMIDAETLVENDELVENKILSYSAGLVEDVKIVGEPKKTGDGLFQVRVQAKVKKTSLVERLEAATKTASVVNGEGLYQQIVSARQSLSDAAAVIQSVFRTERVRFIVKAAPNPDASGNFLILDPATGEVSVRVKTWVDTQAFQNWIGEMLEKLEPMAVSKNEATAGNYDLDQMKEKGIIPNSAAFPEDEQEDFRIKVLKNRRSLKFVRLGFDKHTGELLDRALAMESPYEWRASSGCGSRRGYRGIVKVSLVDKLGKEIQTEQWPDDKGHRVLVWTKTVNRDGWSAYNEVSIIPAWQLLDYWNHNGTNSLELEIPFGKLDPEDIKDIDKVEVEVLINGPNEKN